MDGRVRTRDHMEFSHRLLGPLNRFRASLKATAAEGDVCLIRIRKGDYLVEMKLQAFAIENARSCDVLVI